MKKMIVLILGLFVLYYGVSFLAYEEVYVHDIDEQITTFSNLVVEDGKIRFLNQVALDSEGTFTMVFDEAFMGTLYASQTSWVYSLCYDIDTYCFDDLKIIKDTTKKLYYATFMSPDDFLYLKNIPAEAASGLNFVIYKGEYSHFKGFEYYQTTTYDEGIYLVNYDRMVSLEDIKGALTANDNVDGDLTNDIEVITDEFSSRTNKLGEFLVKFGVKDQRHNQSFYHMYVRVLDLTAPVISGQDQIEIELNVDDKSLSQMISKYTVQDNIDVLSSSNILISKDTYTANQSKLGNYMVELSVKDLSNNISQKEVMIRVKDTTPPSIKGPSVLFSYLSESIKTLEDIKRLYNVTDLVDSEASLLINYDLTTYQHQLGDHVIKIEATDLSNNKVTKEVVVKVIDDLSPTFDVSDFVLKRSVVDQMTKEELVSYLTRELKTRNNRISDVEIMLNEAEYGSKDEDHCIYFSYILDGKLYQSKLKVLKEVDYIPIVVMASIGVIFSISAGIFIKKKWF